LLGSHLTSSKILRIAILWSGLLGLLLWWQGCNSNPLNANHDTPIQTFQATDSTFEVLTWNVQSFPRLEEATISAVLRIIRQLDVDVVALQEITSASAFQQLLDSLADWSGYLASSAAYDINLAFLYKDDSNQTGTVIEILNSTADRRPFPRAPLWLQLQWQNHPLDIINNHFKASGDGILGTDPYDEERRRLDASLLLDQYVRSNLPNANVIILGDLNDELTDPPAHNVFMPFLDRPAEYLFCDLTIAQGNSSNWSYPSYPSHIDHILISNELFDEFQHKGSLITVIKAEEYLSGGWNEYARIVSDHRPVALKLVF